MEAKCTKWTDPAIRVYMEGFAIGASLSFCPPEQNDPMFSKGWKAGRESRRKAMTDICNEMGVKLPGILTVKEIPQTYSLWGEKGETKAHTLIGGTDLHDEEAVCLKVFEASSWEEANQVMHDFNGWEPYKP